MKGYGSSGNDCGGGGGGDDGGVGGGVHSSVAAVELRGRAETVRRRSLTAGRAVDVQWTSKSRCFFPLPE